MKNGRQGFCVWWSRPKSSPCPAREFRKSPKFPRWGKYFHKTEGTRVQGNLSCRSSPPPHASTRRIQTEIKSWPKLKDAVRKQLLWGKEVVLPVWVMHDVKQHSCHHGRSISESEDFTDRLTCWYRLQTLWILKNNVALMQSETKCQILQIY